MKLFVSGLVNVETNLKVRSFPVTYYPIDYPFFGISSSVSGVGYNITVAAKTLGDTVDFASFIGRDFEGERISRTLDENGISREYIFDTLSVTPVSVVLFEPDGDGRRQIYCDLKDIQDKTLDISAVAGAINDCELCVLCNTNYNRPLLDYAKNAGKVIATDVHAITDIHDKFNADFMKKADILFMSDENLRTKPVDFMNSLKAEYGARIIVIGLGGDGAMLYERTADRITTLPAAKLGGIVNTVGAGDALFTSFNHYYMRGESAVEALKRAEVFAALKIRHDGGAKGFPTEAQVDEVFGNYKFN